MSAFSEVSGVRMAGCWNCSAAFDLNGQNRLAEINSNKSLSLREIAPMDRDAARTHCKASICTTRRNAGILRCAQNDVFGGVTRLSS